jgi:hypothetical protein
MRSIDIHNPTVKKISSNLLTVGDLSRSPTVDSAGVWLGFHSTWTTTTAQWKKKLLCLGVAKWMDWMDMDLDPSGWIKKGSLVHYNPLFCFLKKNHPIHPIRINFIRSINQSVLFFLKCIIFLEKCIIN